VSNEGTTMDSMIEGEGRNSNIFIKVKKEIIKVMMK
jgi:hypothetical protein